MPQENLDKKDLQLLYLLDINGRMPYSELARKTKMSKQLVKYRITRLERDGIIKGYYTMIDTSRLGFTTFRVYLKLRNITETKKSVLLAYLHQQKQVWAIVLIAGNWDIALGISVENIYDFHEFWDAFLEKHLEHIKDYKTCIYSPIYHYPKKYLNPSKEITVRILGGKEKVLLDDVDLKILNHLSKNARSSLIDIAPNVGMSAENVAYRLKQLQKKNLIQGFRAMIDVSKLGYSYYKAEIRLSNYKKMNSITQYCQQHKNIYQVDKTIGGETLEIEFHVKELQDMFSIISEMEKIFPGTIESTNYVTVLSEEKMSYMPT